MESGDKKKTTLDLYRGTWNRHVKDYWGNKDVDAIAVEDVLTWLSAMRRDHVPARTRQLSFSILSHALGIAARREYILRNPCTLLDKDQKPKAPKREVPVFGVKQMQHLMKAAKGS